MFIVPKKNGQKLLSVVLSIRSLLFPPTIGLLATSRPRHALQAAAHHSTIFGFGVSIKKNLLKNAWMWIPKYTCWKLWLERNNRLFRGENCTTNNVISKIKALLGETLDAKPTLRNEEVLDSEEELWLKILFQIIKSILFPRPLPMLIGKFAWKNRSL